MTAWAPFGSWFANPWGRPSQIVTSAGGGGSVGWLDDPVREFLGAGSDEGATFTFGLENIEATCAEEDLRFSLFVDGEAQLAPNMQWGVPDSNLDYAWDGAGVFSTTLDMLAAEVLVYVCCGDGELPDDPDCAVAQYVPPTVPSAPNNLAAVFNDPDVDLTWETPDDDGGIMPTGYEVARAELPDLSDLTTIDTSATESYTDTTADPDTDYWYVVRAVNPVGAGADSTSAAVWTGVGSSPAALGFVTEWDAAETGSLTIVSNALSAWAEKFGRVLGIGGSDFGGLTGVQATAANRPAMNTRTINGIAVPDFDGTNDRMTFIRQSWSVTGPVTWFAVIEVDSYAAEGPVLFNQSGGGSAVFGTRVDGTTAELGIESHDSNGDIFYNSGETSTDPIIVVVRGTAPNSPVDPTSVRINGVEVGGANVLSYSSHAVFCTLGSNSSTFFNGAIAHIGSTLLNTILTDPEVEELELMLADKWGITL